MAEPPFTGAVQDRFSELLAPVTVSAVMLSGTLRGMALPDAHVPIPTSVTAAMRA